MSLKEKITGTLHKLWYNNPVANKYFRKKRKKLLNKEFINSSAYDELMLKYNNNDLSFINDAEEKTENFKYRHLKYHKILGAWRWKGLWQNKELISEFVFNNNLKGIDFGGANGPISSTITIVDFADKDSFKRPVKYKSLSSIDFKLDYIFSSHTLEHIKDLDSIFNEFKNHLKENAQLFFLVPAYTCVRWQSGIHTNKAFNDHAWTFCLEKDYSKLNLKNLLSFDQKVKEHFTIKSANYVGDNSIFVHAVY